MSKRRGLWVVYRVCAVAVVTAMAWLTSDLLALERAQQEARADAAHEETMRVALWRMDSWLGPQIIDRRNDNSRRPSLFRGEYVLSKNGDLTLVAGEEDPQRLGLGIDVTAARRQIDSNELRLASLACEPAADAAGAQNAAEYVSRARANFANQTVANGGRSLASGPGPLTPLWIARGTAEPALVFIEREGIPTTISFRGGFVGTDERFYNDLGGVRVLVGDWDLIRSRLLAQVADILPGATLRPITDGTWGKQTGHVLAGAPIAFDAPRPPSSAIPFMSATRVTLGIAWFSILASLAAVGVTLKRTSDLSERRSRFASSVTHELRTPLTTFRLYSEMLADGMLADPAQRQVYLDTLKTESARLATLVENVLAYSRVEEGRLPLARAPIAMADLLLRVAPPLDRRAKDAGTTLSVETGDAAAAVVNVDADIVGQILFNLVDNACKYAAIPAGRGIALNASVRDGTVRIAVRDHGPGIAHSSVRAAFTPFERGGRPPGDVVPGIGLGLALSRALARDLGGDLDYEPAEGGGACFVLTLPAS